MENEVVILTDAEDAGGALLRTGLVAFAGLCATAVFAMFVFGIFIKDFRGDPPPWPVAVFLFVFFALPVGISIYGLGKFLRELRVVRAFGPGELLIPRAPLRLGERVRVNYRRERKRPGEVERLEAVLYLREYVVVSNGKNSTTHIHRDRETPLASSGGGGSPADAVAGAWNLEIPRDGPGSVERPGIRLAWTVEVRLRAGGVSDTSSFALPVIPAVVA